MVACRYGDLLCPCQDGDACHYEDYKFSKAMKICGNCEYFDNGLGELSRSGHGDCLNTASGRFQTDALSYCEAWSKGT